MKVSRAWLNKHFKDELPSTKELADALTFHAFEIEEYDEDMLDVKVLPDRAAYALSHRGIAYELSAILGLPMSYDHLAASAPEFPSTDVLDINCDSDYVIRHTGALMRGVKVGPSPSWLKESLEAVGQRSINNVVDALNCVMLATGQPSGAFDLGKMGSDNGVVKVDIRKAKKGEKITVLTGEEYELSDDMHVFADRVSGTPLDIAGIKGGLSSGVTEETTDLFLSCGTYDPALIRRTSQRLKLFTDASLRYQNRPSPELTAYGMKHILDLIREVAGGEVVGAVDYYPSRQENAPVRTSLQSVNARLGSSFSKEEVEGVFSRLKLDFKEENREYVVVPPFYRRDIVIPEDLAEEVGRILGYDRIEGALLPEGTPPDRARFNGIERLKDLLVERGFVEVSTPSFSEEGEVALANPLDKTRPYLRASLGKNVEEALTRAVQVAPRVLGPEDSVRLFEVGNVFTKEGEKLHAAFGYRPLSGKKKPVLEEVKDALSDTFPSEWVVKGDTYEFELQGTAPETAGKGYAPEEARLQKFKPFSLYPFAYRDIAVWSPAGTEESEVANLILAAAGEHLVRMDLFDRFEKDGRISHAFRLVFESAERTLSDADLSPAMGRVTDALNAKEGWEVR